MVGPGRLLNVDDDLIAVFVIGALMLLSLFVSVSLITFMVLFAIQLYHSRFMPVFAAVFAVLFVVLSLTVIYIRSNS